MNERVPISMEVALRRLNRRLAAAGQVVRVARSTKARESCGGFYTISTTDNRLQQTHVDPVRLARDHGAIAEWETVAP